MDEVKISAHNYWEEGGGDILVELRKEGRGTAVIRRTIDNHDLPFEVQSSLKNLQCNEEFAPVHAAHLEGGILNP